MASRMQTPYSPRAVVGAGTTIAAASLAPTYPATGNDMQKAKALTAPAGKYPKPPFKRQSQPWPGLASQMDPPPDHGERSYRGSGPLPRGQARNSGGGSGLGSDT